jgi:hypothetical protein
MPPLPLILEILQVLLTIGSQAPEVISLITTATAIAQKGFATADEEAQVRAQLDSVKALIDAA